MSNVYDRVLRENVGEMILPFASRHFGIKVVSFKPLPEKIQLTRDCEVDFVAQVRTEDGQDLILHIEFQTTNDPKLHFRMLDYHAALILKYGLSVLQAVVYLGRTVPAFRTRLEEHEIMRDFLMVDVGRTSSQVYLQSEAPEEVILGILADFEGQEPNALIHDLILRIYELCRDASSAQKFLQQLRIISQIRKLEPNVSQEIENMPLNIDIRRDPWFQRGKKLGEERGKKLGEERGARKMQERIAMTLLADGQYSDEQVAKSTGLKIEEVLQLKREVEKGGHGA